MVRHGRRTCSVARSEDEARAKATAAGYAGALIRDEDVLDALVLIGAGALLHPRLAGDVEQDLFLPNPDRPQESVLVTGFDIIFFWVARMIMMTTQLHGPGAGLKHVYIHGLVRDAQGRKMPRASC